MGVIERDTGFKIFVTKKTRVSLTPEKVKEHIDKAIGLLENEVITHKVYLLNKIETWVVFNDMLQAWEVGLAVVTMQGKGRRSKGFIRRQVRSLATVLPQIRGKVVKEMSKLIIKEA